MDVTVGRIGALCEPFAIAHGVGGLSEHSRVALGGGVGSGGFGEVHKVEAIDGVPPRVPLVGKLFAPVGLAKIGGRQVVIDTIDRLYQALEADAGPGWPEMVRALPWVVAEARVKGEDTLLALMCDLQSAGYESSPFADGAPADVRARYVKRPLDERIEFAISFAEKAALLERIRFIHGDLNPENTLVNYTTRDVQIIDFDGGAVVVTGRERPLVQGKTNSSMPPEIKGVGTKGPPVDRDKLTLEAERWSTGSGIGYLLFRAHPAFFLTAISGPVIDAYSRHPVGWPEIDSSDPYFHKDNDAFYRHTKRELAGLPGDAQVCFRELFAAGLDGHRRPTAEQWFNALSDLREPPEFTRLEVSEEWVLVGQNVTVSWTAENASSVEISGVSGTLPAKGSRDIPIHQAGRILLRARNAHATVQAATPEIVPVTPPRLTTLPLPVPPRIDLTLSIPQLEIAIFAQTSPDGEASPLTMSEAFFANYDAVGIPLFSWEEAFPPAPSLLDFLKTGR